MPDNNLIDINKKFVHKDPCDWIFEDGYQCEAPKVKGSLFCRHHPPKSVRDLAVLKDTSKMQIPNYVDAEYPPDFNNMNLNNFDDIVRWKRDITLLVRTGKLTAVIGKELHQMLTSLSQEMERRDKQDPDKMSKRVFTAEAAARAARNLTGEEALDLLRSGNFLDFFQNTDVDAEEVKEIGADNTEIREKIFAPPPPSAEQIKLLEDKNKLLEEKRAKILELVNRPEEVEKDDHEYKDHAGLKEAEFEEYLRSIPREEPEDD